VEYIDVLLDNLPSAELYERSLMHKENVNMGSDQSKMYYLVLASPKI
jgi:hypothetical protein